MQCLSAQECNTVCVQCSSVSLFGCSVSFAGSSSSSSLSGAVAPAPQDTSTVFTSVLNGVVTSGGVSRPPAQVYQKQQQQRKRALAEEEAKDGGDAAADSAQAMMFAARPASASSTTITGPHHRILSAHRPLSSPTVDSPSSSSSRSKKARTGHAHVNQNQTPSQVVADSLAKVMHLSSPSAVAFNDSITMSDPSSLNNTASTAQISLNSTSSSAAAGAFCSLNVPLEGSDEEEDDLSSGDESDDEGRRVRRSRQRSRVTPAPQAISSSSAAAAVPPACSSSNKLTDQDHMAEDALNEAEVNHFEEEEDEGEEPLDLSHGLLAATQARALKEIEEEERRDRELEEEAAAEAEESSEAEAARAFEIQVTAPAASAAASASAAAAAAVPVPPSEEFACEESLEDDVTVGRSASPAAVLGASTKMPASVHAASLTQLVHLAPASSHAYVNSLRFSLPPSIYRSYHSKDPLIASIESALDEIDPDFEMHMWTSEQTYAPYPFYINFQQELDSNMRPVLVSWMMEVAAEYCLGRETIHLAINYLDRFLAASPWDAPADGPQSRVDRQSLQLLGVTALFIAAKIEEIHPPSAEDMAETTADACNVAGIFAMERTILSVLGWRLHAQTPYAFLKLFLKKTARLVFKEFEEKARHLFVQAQRAQASQSQAEWNAAQAEATAAAAVASASVSGAAVAAGSAVLHAAAATASSQAALTIHASHSHFSLLQLSFLQDMEALLSQALFVRMMELLDVIALDMHSLRFYPSQLAAAALYIFFPAGSSMHAHVFGATGYAAADLEPALRILRLFLNMEPVGLPNEHARTLMLNLAIPYDELFMRQVHNPAALALVQAHGAEFTDDGVAQVHTNVFRNIPVFLPPSIYAEMHAQSFVVPIRNHHVHRSDPTMWQLNPYANHLDSDPVTAALQAQQALEIVYERVRAAAPGEAQSAEMIAEAEAALAYRNAMLAQLQSIEAAQAAAAAGGSASLSSAAAADDAPPPIKPQSESFLAAASKPYTRLPPHAVHAGNANQAARAAKKAAAAAASSSSSAAAAAPAAPSRVTVTTSSSAALAAAAAAASASATAVYTFGALGASGAAAAPAPIHAPHAAASSSSSAAAASSSSRSRPPTAPALPPVHDEWEDSDDDRMDGAH